MRAFCDMARDFVEMELHHLCIGVGKRQRRAFALGGTDRAEEIGVPVALVGGLTRTRSAPRPWPHEAVLLTNAGFVLKPDLDRRSRRQVIEMSVQRLRKVFLKASTIRASCAGWRGLALMWVKPSFLKSVPT